MEQDRFIDTLGKDKNPLEKCIDDDHDIDHFKKWCKKHDFSDLEDCCEYYGDEEKMNKNDWDDWDDDDLDDEDIALIAALVSIGCAIIITVIIVVVAKVKGWCCFKPKNGHKNKKGSSDELLDRSNDPIVIEDDDNGNERKDKKENLNSQEPIVYPNFNYDANNAFQQQQQQMVPAMQPMQPNIYGQQPMQQAPGSILCFSSPNMMQGGYEMMPVQQQQFPPQNIYQN